ncbi:MAG: response regulator [Verrucomicrobia bacterium]|nr:response regulator [Verrucomicrobiota bacterium]
MARILVIDDSVQVREAMASCLPGAGHSVVLALDGESGLDKADPAWIDLVLLDVELPRMSGIEVCRALKRDRRLARIPVLMMTGRPTPAVERQALAAGAVVMLGKPFSLEKLLAEVERLLSPPPPGGDREAIAQISGKAI